MPQKRKYCNHCKEYIAISTFKRHKLDYYDPDTKQWTVVSGKRNDKRSSFDGDNCKDGDQEGDDDITSSKEYCVARGGSQY